MSELSPQVIEHALSVARKHGFAEIELAAGDASFRAKLDPIAKQKSKRATTQETAEPTERAVRAPLVGYYSAARKHLKAGQHVKAGDLIANINALGINNDVESPYTGEILEVLVTDGQPVEYGQVLAILKES